MIELTEEVLAAMEQRMNESTTRLSNGMTPKEWAEAIVRLVQGEL